MRDLRSAFQFLKVVAFHDMAIPAVRIEKKALRKVWGYYYANPPTIEIDSGIKDGTQLLRVMAHEMCHAVLEQSAACDHHHHDATFQALAEIVCERMGWRVKGF